MERGGVVMPWSTLLDPVFLITIGLVLASFLPLVVHIWLTWVNGGKQSSH